MNIRNFLHQLLRPRFSAVIAALLTAILLLPVIKISMQHIMVLKSYYDHLDAPDNDGEETLFMAYKINHLLDPAKLSVIILGSSTMHCALGSDVQMSALVSEKVAKPIQVINLSTANQSILTSLALLDNLKLKPGSLIILQLGALRFEQGLDAERKLTVRRIPFIDYGHADALLFGEDMEDRYMPAIFKYGLWINYVYKLIPNLQNKLEASYMRYYGYQTRMSEADLKNYNQVILEKVCPNYIKDHVAAVSLTRAIVDEANKKNLHLVIVLLPISSEGKQFRNKIAIPNAEDMAALKKLNVPIYDFEDDARFSDVDFYDFYHLLENGRKKLLPLLLDIIVNAINKDDVNG